MYFLEAYILANLQKKIFGERGRAIEKIHCCVRLKKFQLLFRNFEVKHRLSYPNVHPSMVALGDHGFEVNFEQYLLRMVRLKA